MYNFDNISIPTYIINLKSRPERLIHIKSQFDNKPEFDINVIAACTHTNGRIGLWNSIRKVVRKAIKEDDDAILICEDDHAFTTNYSKEYLFKNIIEAHDQGIDILSGGVGGFGLAIPVAKNRYWIDWFYCTQFIIIYKKFYERLLEYRFEQNDAADHVLSQITPNKLVLFPFISVQIDFGYSDCTPVNNIKGTIENQFTKSEKKLNTIHHVSSFYNYSNT